MVSSHATEVAGCPWWLCYCCWKGAKVPSLRTINTLPRVCNAASCNSPWLNSASPMFLRYQRRCCHNHIPLLAHCGQPLLLWCSDYFPPASVFQFTFLAASAFFKASSSWSGIAALLRAIGTVIQSSRWSPWLACCCCCTGLPGCLTARC